MDAPRVTAAAEVVAPITSLTVKLSGLRTRAGDPVYVLCERMPEEVALEVMEALPGERPVQVGGAPPALTASEKLETLRVLSPRVIEAACSLVDAEGGKVSPGFYWDESRRAAGSLPGVWLSLEDKANLTAAVLLCNGFGGADSTASFHAEERGGADGRLGVAPALAERGQERVGVAPRSAPRVQPRGSARSR